jgi:hypothetical protein
MAQETSKLETVMAKRTHLEALLMVAVAVMLSAGSGRAQSAPASNPAPCSVVPQPDPCGSKPADKPDAAKKFPFPGEPGGTSTNAPDASAPSLSGVPAAPDTSSPQSGATKKFPFPGESKDAAPSVGASGSSSSSSSGDDALPVDPGANPDGSGAPGAGGAGLKDKGSEGTSGRHLLHRVNPVGTKLLTADQREAEDLDVAQTYIDQGDLQGAYMRRQDAVKTVPDDPVAHFALAEIALKLNKRDEAIAEYNACLKLDPVDKQAKAARKALARLEPQKP